MATEITNLTNAIQELIRKITGSTTSSATSATSTGIVQGVAEAAVTATVINTGSNKMVEAVKTMNDNFQAFVPIKSQAFSSGSTGSRKVDPDGPIGVGVINGPPGSKPAKPPEKDPKEEKEKGVGMLTRFNSWIKKASVALAAFVAIGMRNTVEGYKLGLAFDRLSYQLADAMHYPIVYLTSAINQIAAEFNYLNKIPFARSIMSWAGMLLIGGTALMGLWKLFAPLFSGMWTLITTVGILNSACLAAAAAMLILGYKWMQPYIQAREESTGSDGKPMSIWKKDPKEDVGFTVNPFNKEYKNAPFFENAPWNYDSDGHLPQGQRAFPDKKSSGPSWEEFFAAQAEKDRKAGIAVPAPMKTFKHKTTEEEHNKPLYQTSFMQLTALWETMNKAVTENPGLDVVSSWLEKIFNKMPEPDKGGNPQPRAQGAVAP